MPTRGGHETREERAARELVERLEPTARKELSAKLMTKRLETALQIGGRDVTSEDLAAVARIMTLEALGCYYRARHEELPIGEAVRCLGEARKGLMAQAELLGKIGPRARRDVPAAEDIPVELKDLEPAWRAFLATPEGQRALAAGSANQKTGGVRASGDAQGRPGAIEAATVPPGGRGAPGGEGEG